MSLAANKNKGELNNALVENIKSVPILKDKNRDMTHEHTGLMLL